MPRFKESSLPKPLQTPFQACLERLEARRQQSNATVLNCQGMIFGAGVTTLLQTLKSSLEKQQGVGKVTYIDWATWFSQYPTPDGLEYALANLGTPSVLLLDHVPWLTNDSVYTQIMGEWLKKNFLHAPKVLIYGSLRFWKPRGLWPKPEEPITAPSVQKIPWYLSNQLKSKSERDALLDYLQQWKKWEQQNFRKKPLATRLQEWCSSQGKISGWEWPAPWCSELAPKTDFHPALKPWMKKACKYRLWEPLFVKEETR